MTLLNEDLAEAEKCRIYNELGMAFILFDYDSAFRYAGLARQLSISNSDKGQEAEAMNTLGGVYFYRGKYNESLKCYIRSAELWRELGNNELIGGAYNNIGNICYFQGNYDKAIEYYKNSAELYEKAGNRKGIAQAYYNISNIYQDLDGHFEDAVKYMKLSLALFRQIGNMRGVAYGLNGLGYLYDQSEDIQKSEQYYNEALSVFESIGDLKGSSATLAAIGTLYQKAGDFQKAESCMLRGLDVARDLGARDILMQIYQALGELYDQKNEHKNALAYYKLYYVVKDSLDAESNNQLLSETEAKYNTQLKQNQIEKQNAEIRQQDTLILVFICGFVVVLVIAVIVFYLYRNNQRLNRILIEQKGLIEKANLGLQQRNEEITHQRDEIEKNLKYTQKLQDALKSELSHYMQLSLRKIINPHFIFNSLNSIQSYILQNDKLEASIYLSQFADLMRMVLEQSQKEYITVAEEIGTINYYAELESKRFDGRFQWKIYDGGLAVHELLMPPLLLQPFVENSIWHGLMPLERDGEFYVSFSEHKGGMLVSIGDNGVGRKQASANKAGKHKESHGIRITEERIKAVNSLNNCDYFLQYSDLEDENGNSAGTRVEFLLPLIKTDL